MTMITSDLRMHAKCLLAPESCCVDELARVNAYARALELSSHQHSTMAAKGSLLGVAGAAN